MLIFKAINVGVVEVDGILMCFAYDLLYTRVADAITITKLQFYITIALRVICHS